MSLDSVQKNTTGFSRRAGMFEEMQREDFLALAAALRRFSTSQVYVQASEPARRVASEPRLLLALE